MDYSLAQLRGFVAVATEGHFGRAAQALNMTQPPLTRQIQSLERAIGVQLLIREGGVQLTAAGEIFLADARRILAFVDAAPDSARRASAGESGTIRLGFTAIGAYAVLGDVLDVITTQLPSVEVELVEQVSADQFDGLIQGRLDLGLVRTPIPAELTSVPIHEEELVLAVPSGHDLADRPGRVALTEISAGYIGYSPEGARYLHDVCAAMVAVQDFIAVEIASQVPTMLALVRAERGFALIPRSCTAMRVEGVSYKELAVADRQVARLHACWNPLSRHPVLRRLTRHLGR